jgi:hypothetical protein
MPIAKPQPPVVIAELDDEQTEAAMRRHAATSYRAAIRHANRKHYRRRRGQAAPRPTLGLISVRTVGIDCTAACGHRVKAGQLLARRHGAWVCIDCRIIDKEREGTSLVPWALRWWLAARAS